MKNDRCYHVYRRQVIEDLFLVPADMADSKAEALAYAKQRSEPDKRRLNYYTWKAHVTPD